MKDLIKTYVSKGGRVEIRYRVGSTRYRETVKADAAEARVAEIRRYLVRCQRPINAREVEEYRAAVDLLPEGVSLVDAVRRGLRVSALDAPATPVGDAVPEYIDHCRSRGLSERTVSDRRLHLHAFASSPFIARVMESVGWADVEAHLGGFASPKTANTHRATLVSFFDWWCRKSGAATNPAKQAEPRKVPVKDPVPFTPVQLHRLLEAAYAQERPDALLFLALGAYAGVRAAEVGRLVWGDVWDSSANAPRAEIALSSAITKTNRRRVVPVFPALAEALTVAKQADSLLFSDPERPLVTKRLRRRVAKVAGEAGVEWVDNGLRKGFVSASVALHGVERTAAWAGHSPSVLEASYKALVSEVDANEWFSIQHPNP